MSSVPKRPLWLWLAIAVLLGLCLQSLVWPMELFRSYHVVIHSSLASAVFLTRESDVYVTRIIVPYPAILIGLLAGELIWRKHIARRGHK